MAELPNYQLPSTGFDSYLQGIIPQDQAVAAGAFSVSMLQIRDITKVDAAAFAKIVYSMESIKGLNLIQNAGVPVPVNIKLATQAAEKQALGSGPYGTYTMSNYFGAMSGLIYAWQSIYNGIKNLETKILAALYQNLYLAVTWQKPLIQWDGKSFNYISRGGGYGRDGAAPPTATVNGIAAPVKIGTDPLDLTTYGRIVSIDYSGPAGPVRVSAPPGNGWPAMDLVVQNYMNQVNAEIQDIKNTASVEKTVNLLNAYWKITGIALKIEQRARFIALSPVPVPYDIRLADRPTTIVGWVDSLCGWSSETLPHMHVQNIEHICDLRTEGGQSIIALMRSCRNETRLSDLGIIVDNNVPAAQSPENDKSNLTNGTDPSAVPGSGIDSPCGLGTYTIPSNPIDTNAYNYIANGTLYEITTCKEGSIAPILECVPDPVVNINCSPQDPGVPKSRPINPFVVDFNNFPQPKLNSDFTGTTLLPSIYNVNEAIEKVVECNCECWIK